MKIVSAILVFVFASLNVSAEVPGKKLEGDSCKATEGQMGSKKFYCDKDNSKPITISELYASGWKVVAMTAIGSSSTEIVIERDKK